MNRVLERLGIEKITEIGRPSYHIYHRALGRGLGSGGDDPGVAMAKIRD